MYDICFGMKMLCLVQIWSQILKIYKSYTVIPRKLEKFEVSRTVEWGEVAHFDECVWSLTTISTSNFYMNFDFTVVKQIIVVNVSITLTVKGNRLYCGTAFKIDVKKSHFSCWKTLCWKS